MNKYLNIIIIVFFSILTSNYNIGFTLYIPIVCYLAFTNNKTLFLIVPTSLLALIWFNSARLIEVGILLSLIIIYLMLTKANVLIYNTILVFGLTLGLMLYNFPSLDELIYNLLFSFISAVLYIYFCYNQEGALIKDSASRNFAYNEVVMAIIAVIGATSIKFNEIYLSVFVAIFFSMYLSKTTIHFILFSLV